MSEGVGLGRCCSSERDLAARVGGQTEQTVRSCAAQKTKVTAYHRIGRTPAAVVLSSDIYRSNCDGDASGAECVVSDARHAKAKSEVSRYLDR